MIEIDWRKDYDGEFVCPNCHKAGMEFHRNVYKYSINNAILNCPHCHQNCQTSLVIKINPVPDLINKNVIWYTNHKIQGFVCPDCEAENMYYAGIDKNTNITRLICRTCRKRQHTSNTLRLNHVARKSSKIPMIKSFVFDNSKWDLRAINPNFSPQDLKFYRVDFSCIKQKWLKEEVKKYIYHLCKLEKSYSLIRQRISALKSFSNYLQTRSASNIACIDRSLIIDYLCKEKKINKSKLGSLRDFFLIGTVKGWFNIDQDIIRDEDYPKRRKRNPEPLSDVVREQIEQNLHRLPDPIARMWIICFFAAMRPGELALLKQDCLVQEGQYWKLTWQREKGSDCHEVPISRTIAKVVQEQLSYIQDLWGQEWNYLFCHYHGLSTKTLALLDIKPVKKVIPTCNNTLIVCIRTLIKDLSIKDENGQPAKFKAKVLRTTRLTQLFEQGHDLAIVSAWAGHKHFATTSIYYTKVSCDLIEQEVGHIQKTLVNSEGHRVPYESFPKSFWETPQAHKLELSQTHINTPIYGYCGLDLDQDCHKFRACYTCSCFVATPEKLPQYIKTRDELRGKQSKALAAGQDVLVEQFSTQADQLDKIIGSLQEAA